MRSKPSSGHTQLENSCEAEYNGLGCPGAESIVSLLKNDNQTLVALGLSEVSV